MTHFGNESLKICVVWFWASFGIEIVYCYRSLYHLFGFWNSAVFILNVHVSHFCSDQKSWIHEKLKVQCVFIIIKPGSEMILQ